jgi:hypothetical protein
MPSPSQPTTGIAGGSVVVVVGGRVVVVDVVVVVALVVVVVVGAAVGAGKVVVRSTAPGPPQAVMRTKRSMCACLDRSFGIIGIEPH